MCGGHIRVITSYNAQRALYLGVINQQPLNCCPTVFGVATIDSMQGHESDFVLLDWVIGAVVSQSFAPILRSFFFFNPVSSQVSWRTIVASMLH